MDMRIIQTFIRIAENRSFTKTAKELNYAQSTVTTQIQQLEKELGYQLFDRIGRTVSLTSSGTAFLRHAYEIQRSLEQAMTVNAEPKKLHGSLRVGVLESLLFATMLEILPQFRSQYPNVQIQLKMGQTTELVQQVKENGLDLVYLSAVENTDAELQCCYKKQEELIFVCSKDHRAKEHTALKDIFSHEFVVTEKSGICYGRLLELAASCGSTVRSCVEVDSTIAIAHAVERGLGIAFLPAYSVQPYLENGTLVKINAEMKPQYYYSQILCHKSRWISPIMEGMIRIITDNRHAQP